MRVNMTYRLRKKLRISNFDLKVVNPLDAQALWQRYHAPWVRFCLSTLQSKLYEALTNEAALQKQGAGGSSSGTLLSPAPWQGFNKSHGRGGAAANGCPFGAESLDLSQQDL